jgi:hypothetical protein
MVAFLPPTGSLLPILLLATLTLGSSNLHDNSPDCDCYVTDGISSEYYQYHRFFDFRGLASDGQYNDPPPNITNTQDQCDEPGQQGYLNSSTFAKDFKLLNWRRNASDIHPVAIQNTLQNIYIETDASNTSATHLTFRTHRNDDFQSTAEMESLQRNLMHASIRLRARVYGASGAVAGMFTYLNDSQESDIEILTRDPANRIRYTNQPNVGPNGYDIAAAGTDATLPDNILWTDWTTHRLDWTPTISVWYANDVFVCSKTYGVPKNPSYLTINMWSNGGNWSYNMTVGHAAYLEIQWIEMVFNTSGPVTGLPDPESSTNPSKRDFESQLSGHLEKRHSHQCGTVCGIDGTPQVGFPVILHRAQAATFPVAKSVWMAIVALVVGWGAQALF